MSGLSISLMVEGQEDVSWPQWLALASAAEHFQFVGLYTSDHYLSEVPRSGRTALDAWGTICALAAVTERVRLGTIVSPVTFRHPSVLAKLAVTADHISGGRVDVGVGAGWMEAEHEAYGFPLPALGERMSLLAEQVEILVRSWSEGPFSFTGRHYELHGLDALPRPIARPHPPLILGGGAGPVSAAIAAAWADEYNCDLVADAQMTERIGRLAAACEAIGRDPSTLRVSAAARVIVGREREEVELRAGRAAQRDGRGDQAPSDYLAGLGDFVVAGTVEEVIERLRTIAALGVNRIMLESIDHTDTEMIELIGRKIIPAL